MHTTHLYLRQPPVTSLTPRLHQRLSSADVFEQWLQCHPEAGLSWPSWPQASCSALGDLEGIQQCRLQRDRVSSVQGYLALKKTPTPLARTPLGHPYDPLRTLGIGLRWGPKGVRFLVSEVPLYGLKSSGFRV